MHGIFAVVHGLELLANNLETDPSFSIACFETASPESSICLHRCTIIMDVMISLIVTITEDCLGISTVSGGEKEA